MYWTLDQYIFEIGIHKSIKITEKPFWKHQVRAEKWSGT